MGLDGSILVWKDPCGIGWPPWGLDGSLWDQMAPSGSEWLPMYLYVNIWLIVTPNVSAWHCMSVDGSVSVRMAPYAIDGFVLV